MDIVKEKIVQAAGILEELKLDCWLIFVRETPVMADPVLPLVVGLEVVWESFFLFTPRGDAIALVGNFDQENFKRSGRFTEVISYTEGVSQDVRKVLNRLDPQRIAIDYSLNNVAADGLSHGMYLLLLDHLKKTPFVDRLVSAEELIGKLRCRKLPSEIAAVEKAAVIADQVWQQAVEKIVPKMTEIEIARLIERLIAETGNTHSFPTTVNAGSKTPAGHADPTDAKLSPGDLLHVDFGVQCDNYCSDIQRLLYLQRPAEKEPPPELIEAFHTVNEIITETATLSRPGVKGFEIDARARAMLVDNGYPEYQHALGHQLGRAVHDGGALIGPRWERYGITPSIPLEENNLFTLELEIMLPGIGCVGLEEDVCITNDGAKFLSPRQMELTVK
ncbi:MAG: aminopeptidase P family protein [Candidatus Zixiibacteriota bacterium]|nr:MAG: aminopeptidase P family protein [candidate division Zixibacteria bacterium]